MTVEAILLGSAQDAGVPQAGCYCTNCRAVREGRAQREYATSLALVDHAEGVSWIIDATPDFREQLALLHEFAPDCPLRGILLTHAHIGHYAGLLHLGRESMNTNLLPVYASAGMGHFLRHNAPWSQLFDLGNIALCELPPRAAQQLSPGLSVEAMPVPHRAEFSDTLAFLVRGPQRSLFHCPDIDAWEAWDRPLARFLGDVDIALLDGTFHTAGELPGRDLSEIPHPLVEDTLRHLEGVTSEVHMVHLNHSNALLADGEERRALRARGIGVGATGLRFDLGELPAPA